MSRTTKARSVVPELRPTRCALWPRRLSADRSGLLSQVHAAGRSLGESQVGGTFSLEGRLGKGKDLGDQKIFTQPRIFLLVLKSLAAQLEIFGFIHHTHPATKLLQDAIVGGGLTDHRKIIFRSAHGASILQTSSAPR